MSDTDLELLARYTRHHAEDAFAEIVRRHLDLVHSAALRQVRSPQLAEEVAQSVFTDLAHNANRLAPGTVLTAWLYQVTRRTAIDAVRREARRQLREQIATEMNTMNATAADWTHIEPLLDEAMHALDETDRTAVLLRYFENKSLREVGQSLGTSDDTAQKRVSRAVERLREFFAKRGVTIGASGLVVAISANAVQAAPVGLAVAISTAAALVGTTLVTATITPTATVTALNLKSVTVVALAALTAGTGTYLVQQREANRLRIENFREIAVQNELLAERDSAMTAMRAQWDELQGLRKDQRELLRLRGEIVRLRQQLEARKVSPLPLTKPTHEAAQDAVHAPGTYIAKDQLSNVGYATPEAALETYFWAVTKGTFEQATESMSPEKLTETMKNSNREQLEAELKRQSPSFKGIQVMARKVVADHEVELKFKMDLEPAFRGANPDLPEEFIQSMHKIGEQWKMGAKANRANMEWDEDPLVQKFTP